MAKLKKDSEPYITIHEDDYKTLLQDHITLKALKIAGIEKTKLYKSIDSILRDDRVEVHIKPVVRHFKSRDDAK